MTSEPVPGPSDVPSLSSLLWRLGVGLVGLLLAVALLGWTLAEPTERVAALFIGAFGAAGVFVLVLLVDAVPFLTHEPILFLAWTGGFSYWSVVALGGTASFLSGALGWSIGRALGRFQPLHDLFERYRIAPFLRRHGALAVAAGALTPFPYALTTWGAGACGVTFRQVMLGALLRYPKVVFYLSIMVFGWRASTG